MTTSREIILYKQIFRYRPSSNSKVELEDRYHDLGGTHYSHVAYLSKEEFLLKHQEGVRFLYADEGEEYMAMADQWG